MPADGAFQAGVNQSRIWTFAKGGDELTIEQWMDGETVVVTLTRSYENGAETTQGYDFPNEQTAAHFHANLDTSLLQFGWVFIGHLPNRRGRQDRRHLVRKGDRRRWWTDGGTFLE